MQLGPTGEGGPQAFELKAHYRISHTILRFRISLNGAAERRGASHLSLLAVRAAGRLEDELKVPTQTSAPHMNRDRRPGGIVSTLFPGGLRRTVALRGELGPGAGLHS
ncbi:hypothetical protein SZ55_1145 [Pseudomonas sp. FeS53a]|nr:hypothetical protein SZ55_1145 [Pseudomonas sp. FeS53a]